MQFGLLGPVEVRHNGRSLTIRSGRERLLLAVLLLNADRLTQVSRLVDALWDDPPRSARAQLHNMISSLRRRFGSGADELIVTRPAGYELRLGGHDLDVVQFRRLVDRARQAASDGDHRLAVSLLDTANSLWRGPALTDVTGEWAELTRQALHEERLATTEAWLDAALMVGRHDDVLRALPVLIEENPYRERLHEARMVALVGAGRRADGLAAYRETYRRFVDDLGVEPGPRLKELEQRILREETVIPEPVVQLPTPRQLPPVTTVLTGREKLIGELCAELGPRDQPPRSMVLLVGPGGVGKTTLALAVAHQVSGSFPDGQLYANLRGTQDEPADGHGVLGRFLRALGVTGANLPDDPELRVALYRSSVAGRRMLIVLDDAASEEQIRPLLPGTPGCATLITSRRQLAALVGAARWTVPMLAPDAATGLLSTVVGAERAIREPDAAAAIVDLCGHLPLAVCVAAARLAVRPEWTLEEFRLLLAEQRRRLDELAVGDLDVRASIGLSYEALDPLPRLLFRRLGLITAPDWPTWVAVELLGETPRSPVERMLDQLADTHLIEARGRDELGQPRYRLHDLVADFARERALAEDAEPERVAALSRVLTGWLALATEADERIDHGMMFAAGLDCPRAAPEPAPEVVQAPARWFETERVNLVTAVDQACRIGRADLAGGLALRMAGFLTVRSYDDDRDRTLSQAIPLARSHDDRLLIRLLGAQFAVRAQRDRYAELPEIIAEELAVARRLGDPRSEFNALTHAGRTARMLGRFADAARWLEEALATARRTGLTGVAISRALHYLASVHTDRGRPEAALPLLEEALEISRAATGARTTAIYLHSYGRCLIEMGRLTDAVRTLDEALATARDIGDDRGAAWVEHAQADLEMRLGTWSSVASRLNSSLQVQEKVGDQEGTAEVLRSLGDLAAVQGRPRDAVTMLQRSLTIWRRLGNRLEQARTLAHLERIHRAGKDRAVCREEWEAILADLQLDRACLRLPPYLPAEGGC
ncbi:MAG TPA: BTAD domain-containing putative transcriptional regulator [Actinophytocola sp.]|uniref:AfsR/SARP family transcriptional regulator n=1 Tax=Actinophytocola sp. TaxID=1872138 RepID=UPI002DDCF6E5|nr:BTAD domain-containing putative transcriptional regulator [Actinophytocola sp.]HEV2783421.1 BTAD domain-containing putative transcriptional regulator [Actinophytocola sp.]